MPRIDLDRTQPDGTPHWVDLRPLRVNRDCRNEVIRNANIAIAGLRDRLQAAGVTSTEDAMAQIDDSEAFDGGMSVVNQVIITWVRDWSLVRPVLPPAAASMTPREREDLLAELLDRLDAGEAVDVEPLPLPSADPRVLGELDSDDAFALEAALTPVLDKILGRRVSPKDAADPMSPSVPSAV